MQVANLLRLLIEYMNLIVLSGRQALLRLSTLRRIVGRRVMMAGFDRNEHHNNTSLRVLSDWAVRRSKFSI
jgi:hypothetical protein